MSITKNCGSRINHQPYAGKMRIVFLIVFVTSLMFCQNQNEYFVNAPFKKGLPTEIPFKWHNTLYSSINGGEYYKSLFFVSRDSFKTADNCFLFLVVDKENFFTNTFEFEKTAENSYEAFIPITSLEEDTLSPLKIVLNLKEKSLNYRWESKNKLDYKNPTTISEYQFKVGKTFPQIEVETAKNIWSNKDKNKIVVINWWMTSCSACIEEMPGLNELVDKYPEDKVEFIAIIADKANHSKFMDKYEFKYEQGFGNENLTGLFGKAVPRNIILDNNGKILYNSKGGSKNTAHELEKIIKENL